MPESFPSCSLRLRSRLRPTVVLLPTAGCSVRLALAHRMGFAGGSSYLDYDSRLDEDVLVGEYDGATRHDVRREVPIPELVDEASAEGGDSLEVAVARMREFNGRRYEGVLDEDPARHVNAFWYGLKKLSQYCEAAVRVDERAWDCFIDKVQFAYDEPVGRLATQMDEKQVAAFVAAVDALGADE